MFATTNHTSVRTQDALKTTFVKSLSSADIAAMKVRIEGTYKVSFIYSGNEFNYTVNLEGSELPFRNAMNILFPKGRSDIVIQRAHSVG